MYTMMPPSPESRSIAASSCGPQSQRCDPNTSPVRQFECTRTRGFACTGRSPKTSTLFTDMWDTMLAKRRTAPRSRSDRASSSTGSSSVWRTTANQSASSSFPRTRRGSGIGPRRSRGPAPGGNRGIEVEALPAPVDAEELALGDEPGADGGVDIGEHRSVDLRYRLGRESGGGGGPARCAIWRTCSAGFLPRTPNPPLSRRTSAKDARKRHDSTESGSPRALARAGFPSAQAVRTSAWHAGNPPLREPRPAPPRPAPDADGGNRGRPEPRPRFAAQSGSRTFARRSRRNPPISVEETTAARMRSSKWRLSTERCSAVLNTRKT